MIHLQLLPVDFAASWISRQAQRHIWWNAEVGLAWWEVPEAAIMDCWKIIYLETFWL
jgi:hypothetical protein